MVVERPWCDDGRAVTHSSRLFELAMKLCRDDLVETKVSKNMAEL